MFTTIPVYAFKQENILSNGTGFIFSVKQSEETSIPLFITNYHVVEKAITGFVEFHTADKDRPTNNVVRVKFESDVLSNAKLGDLLFEDSGRKQHRDDGRHRNHRHHQV